MCCFKVKLRYSRFKIQDLRYLHLVFYLFLLITFNFQLLTAAENRPFLTDKDQFNYAMFLYKQGHYAVSAREFSRVIDYFPGSQVIPHAQYMIGDAYLNASMYQEAVGQWQQFIKNFPDNEFKTEASLKLEVAKAKFKHVPAGFKQGETEFVAAPKLPVIKAQPNRLTSQPLNFSLPLRAVQVAFFEGRDYQEVGNELDRLKTAGVDTIILRVFHNKDDRFYPFIKPREVVGVYFETKESPVVDDMLGTVLDMAHQKGLKVFAWMTTRYADYGLEHRKDLGCKAYDFYTKNIISCKGLDLFNEEAVYHLEKLFNDLAEYPIDGVLFQDDLVLKHNEGFGSYSEMLYKNDTGKIVIPAELYNVWTTKTLNSELRTSNVQYTHDFWGWAAWKNKRLLQVASRVRAVVKNRNPNAKFAINLMYESISNPTYAMAWLSQSLDEAVKQGFDYYAVMAYHQQMQDELKKEPYEIQSLIQKMTSEAVRLVGEPQKVLMKFQTIDWNTSQPLLYQEVIGLLTKMKEMGDISLAVVPYRKDFPFEDMGGQKKVKQLLR
ncbi:MAG: family 10 glycosylhydrolase [Deltaproteobacteria bacterium]|nr:family 10 glycosylhydrolase [Deltaproteobacteria bacterium]